MATFAGFAGFAGFAERDFPSPGAHVRSPPHTDRVVDLDE